MSDCIISMREQFFLSFLPEQGVHGYAEAGRGTGEGQPDQ